MLKRWIVGGDCYACARSLPGLRLLMHLDRHHLTLTGWSCGRRLFLWRI